MRAASKAAGCLLAAILLTSLPAGAVTLREYFDEFSDRDRAVYMRGLMDLLRSDEYRETAYIRCANDLGIVRIHDALVLLVHGDPRLLSFQVAPWFFYAVGRFCRAEAGSDAVPPPDGSAAAADPLMEPAQNAAIELYVPRADDSGSDAATLWAAAAAALVVGGGVTFALFVRRRPADRDR